MVAHPQEPKPTIVLGGGRMLCPHCEEGGTMASFKALDLNGKYKHDLNPVYKHLACGHVFSPGDPWIIAAYLSGELVPAEGLTALRETVNELRALTVQLRHEAERRPVES